MVQVERPSSVVAGVNEQRWSCHRLRKLQDSAQHITQQTPPETAALPFDIYRQSGQQETRHRRGCAFGDRFRGFATRDTSNGDGVVTDNPALEDAHVGGRVVGSLILPAVLR